MRNKFLVHESILKPVWLHGTQLWVCTKGTNFLKMPRQQNGVLRIIVKAPWCITNGTLHRDLQLNTVKKGQWRNTKVRSRLHQHPNEEALSILENSECLRKLKESNHSIYSWPDKWIQHSREDCQWAATLSTLTAISTPTYYFHPNPLNSSIVSYAECYGESVSTYALKSVYLLVYQPTRLPTTHAYSIELNSSYWQLVRLNLIWF